MHKKEDFKDLTMYEEIAYSITCLEKLCLEWNIKSKKMAAYIEILWGFTKDFDCWEANIHSIERNSKNIERYELKNIDDEKKKIIANMIEKMFRICLGNLYTEYRYTSVLQDILNIEEYLEKNKIECPELKFYIGREKTYQDNLRMLRCDKYNLTNSILFREK
ncbi:hypothetical protein [Clostridium felsineum]|uniref:Uncharacterized protein n=1 Tax=Clostridium felsineum TaxID=36839 RepID=A0A1S8L6V5_9CLOT|nr:hypothetical protein [Clostridium felsineum]URZ02609.1 hypothetical protein CLAUR_026210 [Clostridium felsineum]URZ09716.1 hypothetical protein CROST_004090 [Clostridium felsineum]